MLALVSTVVSFSLLTVVYFLIVLGNSESIKYYAALHEWSSGKHQQQNFTADGSADVYRSHLTSLNSIKTEHKSSYHIMMMDIYQLAASSIGQTAIPVPSLDISTLEMDE
ncbi:hypothetical protein EDB86DRAFT_3043961 [Lactarius hatsudake]|nr:hypothetical protein EDB86DRAFT_3043961 [Lactarius hatsudake]